MQAPVKAQYTPQLCVGVSHLNSFQLVSAIV